MEQETDFLDIDTDLFIDEIEKIRCIWDYTSPEYGDRIEKAEAWEVLCTKFFEHFEEKNKIERKYCVLKLQRKWKSLRDSYNRDYKKAKGATKKRHQYVYFKRLSFLKTLAEKRGDSPNESHKEIEETKNTKSATKTASVQSRRSYLKRKKTNVINTIIDKLLTTEENEPQQKLTTQTQELDKRTPQPPSYRLGQETERNATDGDMHFLLSLYDDFKNIEDYHKLDAKTDMLRVIQKYKRLPETLSNNSYICEDEKPLFY